MKVAATDLNFACGLCWEVAALNRWGYIGKFMRRLALLKLVGLLDAVLTSVVTEMHLDQTNIEQELAGILVLDNENFEIKNKLRVCRLGRTFSAPSANLDNVASIIGDNTLDDFFHAMIGDPKNGTSRATLRQLVDPNVSLVGRSQHRLVNLLELSTVRIAKCEFPVILCNSTFVQCDVFDRCSFLARAQQGAFDKPVRFL